MDGFDIEAIVTATDGNRPIISSSNSNIQAVIDFVTGLAHSVDKNLLNGNAMGLAGRKESDMPDSRAYYIGNMVGDIASIAVGTGEIIFGFVEGILGGIFGGMAACTVVGTLPGVAMAGTAITAGGIVVVGGGITIEGAAKSLLEDYMMLAKGGGSRSKPKQQGQPNSVEIQRDTSGKITKYTEYGPNGEFIKEVRISGIDHGGIPRPNVKEPNYHVNPKTGQTFQNGYKVRPARPDEIPK